MSSVSMLVYEVAANGEACLHNKVNEPHRAPGYPLMPGHGCWHTLITRPPYDA